MYTPLSAMILCDFYKISHREQYHLLSFVGTDTIPAIYRAEKYYNANIEKEMVGNSIPATEHSVMCANGQDERTVFKRLITEVYPNGFLSVVSDTWDFWNIVGQVLPEMKSLIMKRNGKLVIRPDSGDPVKIICGDSITLKRCESICALLKKKGFALKSTACVIDGQEFQLFKNPKTDSGVKKSQKGRVAVFQEHGEIWHKEECGLKDQIAGDLLQEVFRNGKILVDDSLTDIRKRVHSYL